ncbi:DUF6516 family protein [Roseofilum reptotaenium CS-1145]|uniref:Uncharacterized protein n=1 Tax=Roseofilum reptotaenium AO1-A TaxID=1925591 RepID=A0A1L9QQB5_9CYAN|nr:DUF6516 family protein [Roseofilum reptotaenium]MDB9516591.1 DUF6516 family protein [Roseofilum reptotaenium CS-1145]OJJ24888.1 hypothetical protein BI308_14325 [Roseofilum reptotaenium AO1-A]
MLHESLSDYLDRVEQGIEQCLNVYVERYEEEILTPIRVNLRIRLRFNPGHLLEVNEAIVVTDSQLNFLDYRYHFQDEQNRLVFRYDSTPHFPDLPNFPYHKHLPDRVISSPKPNLLQVLQEINE